MHLKKLLYKGVALSVVCAIVATMTLPRTVYAKKADVATEKEEVVYVNLEGDGSVSNVNVVNCFEIENVQDVVDYGEYRDVRNMTTKDKLTYKDGEITAKGVTEKLYYQGTLEQAEIPWDIQIRYYLDGKELSAEELAGKKGELKITFKITENENCQEGFFDGYALQMSFVMDTELAKNIVSEGATIANVGSDKQLTYTILPGKGADYTVTADVTDFEMSEIAINGIRLNLDMEVDDAELMEQITELQEGIGQIDDGSEELLDGAKQLENGLELLDEKSDQLTDGSNAMKSALEALSDVLSGMSNASEKVGALVDASTAIKAGIKEAWAGTGMLKAQVSYEAFKETFKVAMQQNGLNDLDVDSLIVGNQQAAESLISMITDLRQQTAELESQAQQAIEAAEELEKTAGLLTDEAEKAAINEQAATFKSQAEQLRQSASTLSDQAKQLEKVVSLLNGNNAAFSVLEAYLMTVNEAVAKLEAGLDTLYTKYEQFDQGIIQLATTFSEMFYRLSALTDAVSEIADEYGKLDMGLRQYTEGAKELLDGMKELVTGTQELAAGTEELRAETVDMDKEVSDQIEELLNEITGENVPVESFVSEKNTNVVSVQFVIKTNAITIPEEEEAEETETVELTFIEKLTNLFKK